MRSGGQQPPKSVRMRPPRAQHCSVTGSHSPCVQQVRPHTNSRLQQPWSVHDCPGPQQLPPPAWFIGQHRLLTQVKPSAQHRPPRQTRDAGQQYPRWQPSQA
jgi:hypothetical protein